jgi:cbb3-type cytochrome oxidase subunit 3
MTAGAWADQIIVFARDPFVWILIVFVAVFLWALWRPAKGLADFRASPDDD